MSSVLGEAMYYDGQAAFTPYHSTSAGSTQGSEDVWGGASYPYLVAVDSSIDRQAPNYQRTVAITRQRVEDLIESVLGIEVSGDPEDYFVVEEYTSGGYNGTMSVCGETYSPRLGRTITGRVLREQVLGLRSAAFDVEYNDSQDWFEFTTYGYGHGVGMSQNGAILYANEGWSYTDILEHYYPGVTIE